MAKTSDFQKALSGIDKHIWSSELEVGEFIASLIKLLTPYKNATPLKVVETGTFKGVTSCYIINALKETSGGPATFYSIDIEDHRCQSVKDYFEKEVAYFILNDAFTALEKMPARFADLIFLDSFHSYEQVKGEFQRSERVIKQGGLILMHDYYSADGVKQWVDEIKVMPWFEVTILNTPDNRGLVLARCLHVDYPTI